tara:strand:- start:516 stop:656 length:141 start_codon:yes stop_codon:yes gene_type:complete
MITKYKKGQSPEVTNEEQNIIKRRKITKVSHKKKKDFLVKEKKGHL